MPPIANPKADNSGWEYAADIRPALDHVTVQLSTATATSVPGENSKLVAVARDPQRLANGELVVSASDAIHSRG